VLNVIFKNSSYLALRWFPDIPGRFFLFYHPQDPSGLNAAEVWVCPPKSTCLPSYYIFIMLYPTNCNFGIWIPFCTNSLESFKASFLPIYILALGDQYKYIGWYWVSCCSTVCNFNMCGLVHFRLPRCNGNLRILKVTVDLETPAFSSEWEHHWFFMSSSKTIVKSSSNTIKHLWNMVI